MVHNLHSPLFRVITKKHIELSTMFHVEHVDYFFCFLPEYKRLFLSRLPIFMSIYL